MRMFWRYLFLFVLAMLPILVAVPWSLLTEEGHDVFVAQNADQTSDFYATHNVNLKDYRPIVQLGLFVWIPWIFAVGLVSDKIVGFKEERKC